MQDTYTVIGLMSGTSLDGLDIVCATFYKAKNTWNYELLKAETIPYTREQVKLLAKIHLTNAHEYVEADRAYGKWLGEQVARFIIKHNVKADFVSSHGHTVFHNPSKGYSCQLGHGPSIKAACGLPVIFDFRSLDVALDGQGAPLVPVGDELLFSTYEACLNLGGFANISMRVNETRMAWDIAPCNMAFNMLMQTKGLAFDNQGKWARSGQLIQPLFEQLNSLPFYHAPKPKSLSREWFEASVVPVLAPYDQSSADVMHTLVHHAAWQIAQAIQSINRVLVTGGGAYHTFLLETINTYSNCTLHVPDHTLIQFKEALIFAFLGLLRYNNETNVWKSVTGAQMNSVSGSIC